MGSILPFGNDTSEATYNCPVQRHFGSSLVSVDVSADWSSQGGRLSMRLIEENGDKFQVPVIGAPYQFTFVATGVSFSYGGIIQSVERESSNTKIYTVNVESPLKILDSVAVIIDGYTGRGSGIEGNSSLIYGGLPFGSLNSNTTAWNLNYNVINAFGAFENEDSNYGLAFGGSYKHGFGSASINHQGMPITKLIYALDGLINRANGNYRYQGGNILYGTTSYNIALANGIPYYYFFDAIDFFDQVSPYLTSDFRVGNGALSMSLLDIVSQVCDAANMEFIVDLDSTDTLDTPGIDVYSLGAGQFGGTIKIRTINKNAFFSATKPFSNIAYNLIGLEVPQLSNPVQSGIHPGTNVGTGYQDPLDDDYTNVGTNTPLPYGGKFPYVDQTYFSGVDSNARPEHVNLSISATDGVTSKFVVGGFQSRTIQVLRPNIYCYWGDITLINSGNYISGNVSSNLEEYSNRKIPVITQQLHPADVEDYILIDMQSLFGQEDVSRTLVKGIYAASLFEIRLAMKSYENWEDFIYEFKPFKYYALEDRFNPLSSGNRNTERSTNTYDANGNLGYAGLSRLLGVGDGFTTRDTRVKRQSKVKTNGLVDDAGGTGLYVFEDKILPGMYEIIKNIGDQHYGKSWYVPMPVPTTKLADNDVNLVGDFVRSWDIANDAYLEPNEYYTYEAPQSSLFVKNGRISSFVNYDHSFLMDTGVGGLFDDTYSSELTSPFGVTNNVYNFSEYDPESLAYTKYPNNSILHAPPNSVSNRYEFIPANYFTYYNRSIIPFTDIKSKTTKVYNFEEKSGTLPAGYLPNNPTKYSFVSGIIESHPLKLGMREEISGAITNIRSLAYRDHGINHLVFVRVNTGRVYYPVYSEESTYIGNFPPKELFGAQIGTGIPKNSIDTSINARYSFFDVHPATIAPRSITIPQVSNRYVYGPWVTNIGASRLFAGKVVFEQDTNLVPENFIVPNYGNYGSTYNYYSGMSGVNAAGQAIANAIDDFTLFAEEQGSVVIPGLPAISRIGDSLYGIQNVTDMNITINESQIKTTYNFRTYSPRIGKTNREYVKKLQKISNTIKRNQ